MLSTSTQAGKEVKIAEFDRAKALEALGFDDSMFVDFCILCGCDYAGTIRGIGPIRALQLIQVRVYRCVISYQ